MTAIGAVVLDTAGGRMGVLFVLGVLLGVSLYHAAFGFTGSWRNFLAERRGAGLRAQMVMLGVATLIFLPLLANGEVLGHGVSGAVQPAGISVIVGAFLFGVGMQLGGACASGTLFTLGGGSTRMVVTLAFFIVGSLAGSLHFPWWSGTPALGRISVLSEFGLIGAIAVQFAVFAAIFYATRRLEIARHGEAASILRAKETGGIRWLQGPWPLIWGGVALAVLNGLVLAVGGFPWSISFGFALWGAKIASALGADLSQTTFWGWSWAQDALNASVFADTISVMNFGIVLGALLAAGLAGKFAPARRIPWKSALAAALGGLLMGYGARLAYGCNIGAYFSGIASGSLHGWLWLVAGLAGNALGVKLRPIFAMGR
ncbi:YeeE/YedE family protein [Rhodovibrio salinarum]|uniref:YeeE/YedE family protein n=2 Tax=Rhodovibrio salinarum TaxID=1087 RepID=A0A934QGD1_9PROT|nr:YeeE/YedE family protein [Rhodovibrio salinarum]